MSRIGLVFGYNQYKSGDLDVQSIGRCTKALELYQKGKIDKIAITVGITIGGIFMAERMSQFFVINGVPEKNVLIKGLARNTAGEIDIARTIISEDDRIVGISSWYHLPRIWWLWFTRGRFVKLAASYDGVTKRNILREIIKIGFYLFWPWYSRKS